MLLSKKFKPTLLFKPWITQNAVKSSSLQEIPVQKTKTDPKIEDQEETSSENLKKSEDLVTQTSPKLEIIPTDEPSASLIEKRESHEALLNADPFDEVPGPEILRKLSSVWKYLPVVGSQATVSALLSFFRIAQTTRSLKIFGGGSQRPFTRLFEKYGPIVKLQGPLGAEIVLLNRPEHIAKIYDQEGRYPVRSTLDSVEKCRSKTRKNCGGPFNLCGAEWEEIRKAIHEPLTKGGEKYFTPIETAGSLFVQRVRSIRNRQNEVQGDLMMEIKRWSLECLCYVTLNKSLGFLTHDSTIWTSEPARLLKSINDATNSIIKCESGFQLWRIMNTPTLSILSQSCEIIDSILSKHIRQAHLNLTKKKDEFITGNKNTNEDLTFIESMLLNECMTPDEVLTSILDVLLIGVNTTSSALGFMLYHLAQNQRAQRTLFKEIKDVLPEKKSRLQFSQISSLKYLDACMKESFRLKMPMPILTRVLPSDIALSNFRIPKGAYMVMDAQAAGLREQDFEKADKFVPERWLEPENIHPFASIPFGHGSRSCVGKVLAEVQIGVCLAKIIRNFLIEYNYGPIHGTDNVISFPDKPLRLSFIERDE